MWRLNHSSKESEYSIDLKEMKSFVKREKKKATIDKDYGPNQDRGIGLIKIDWTWGMMKKYKGWSAARTFSNFPVVCFLGWWGHTKAPQYFCFLCLYRDPTHFTCHVFGAGWIKNGISEYFPQLLSWELLVSVSERICFINSIHCGEWENRYNAHLKDL